jgi:hypothetical protein
MDLKVMSRFAKKAGRVFFFVVIVSGRIRGQFSGD